MAREEEKRERKRDDTSMMKSIGNTRKEKGREPMIVPMKIIPKKTKQISKKMEHLEILKKERKIWKC